MSYWRGFKTEAHALAEEVRRELGLNPLDPLDPRALAAHLAIQILALSDFRDDAPYAAYHFLWVETDCFSAVTVFDGTRRAIVHNDSHSPGRQGSDLAHELAHALLLHVPRPVLDDRGCRYWDEDMEDEADFLGGALLVTEKACLSVVRQQLTVTEAAHFYGVTPRLMQWRINATGARKRVERAERSYSARLH